MNRNILLFFIISFALVITGCTVVEGEVSDRVISPENTNIPISGKWEATYVYDGEFIPIDDELTFEERNINVYNLEAYFHRQGFAIGESFTEDPSFRIKNVLAYDYLSRNFRFTPEDITVEDERLEVVTVLNEDAYLIDFIRLDEERLLTRYDDIFYMLERVNEEVSVSELDRYIQIQKDVMRTLGTSEEDELQTGFLLGLKIPDYDELSNNVDWEYKTIWINTDNGQISSAYEVDKLLLPRRNGFWEIENNRAFNGQLVRDYLSATPLFRVDNNESSSMESSIDDLVDKLDPNEINSELKNILFVGNDYISVENIDLDDNGKQTLEIYSIDNIRDEIPIKLSEIIGEEGRDLFLEGARSEMSLDDHIVPNEENIGLFRRDGHWSLRGRINYFQSGEELYSDFNIRAIPPTEMVSFDEQVIHYDMVRLLRPGAIDYFSSPNEEFIVVLTNTHITIYPIDNGELVNIPSTGFRIPSNSSIIMSEWARGRYTETWEQEVIENGGVEIDY